MIIKTHIELELEVDVDYTPARPAPQVQCHDHPGYSDPGDDETVEINEMNFVISAHGKVLQRVRVPELLEAHVADKIIDDVTDQCRDAAERKGYDHLEDIKDLIADMHDRRKLAGYR